MANGMLIIGSIIGMIICAGTYKAVEWAGQTSMFRSLGSLKMVAIVGVIIFLVALVIGLLPDRRGRAR